MGVQNNLVLAGFPGDRMILPTVEIVCNIAYFASGTIKGAALAAEPLFGVFYAEWLLPESVIDERSKDGISISCSYVYRMNIVRIVKEHHAPFRRD